MQPSNGSRCPTTCPSRGWWRWIADLNPANVLWDGETCRLVDFEDGGLSEPSYELADHVEHIGSRLPGILDVDALKDAVDLSGEDRERMTRYRPLWAAFWLAMLLPGNGGQRHRRRDLAYLGQRLPQPCPSPLGAW